MTRIRLSPVARGLLLRSAVIIGLGVTGYALIQILRPAPKPSAAVVQAHAMAQSKPAFTEQQHALAVVETVYVHDAATAERSATRARLAADVLARRADSVEQLARAHADTATLWYAAWRERAAEADSLRRADDSLTVALAKERAARLAADTRAFLATARLDTAETLNHELARQVVAKDRCRILPFVTVPCPSRTEVFIAGAVTSPLAIAAGKVLLQAVRP